VPVSLQSLAVVLSGALLGARLGAASLAAYVLAGALGAPVFAYGFFGLPYLFGPTGGYLLAFPLAAAVTGALATDSALNAQGLVRILRIGLAVLCGIAVIFAGGVAQLALLTDAEQAIRVGLLPFVLGDALKAVVATVVVARIGARARTLF
jgi:biotin transport system substrate-specific component